MASTINASTSAGLISSGDTSGVLAFQTNSGTTAVTIDTSQSVAIGSTSTASATRLTVKGAGTGGNTLLNCQDSGGTALLTLAENGNLSFNSGYGSNATAYGCRAWVNFNGTGTVAIRASGNVSSITDNGTANYTVNFSTSLPDINYCIVASGTNAESNGPYVLVPNTYADVEYAPTTTSCRVGALVPGVSWSKDQKYSYVSIFR